MRVLARHILFGPVRLLRRIGAIGLFVMGLLGGAVLIGVLSDEEFGLNLGEHKNFAANAATRVEPSTSPGVEQPWSRAFGKPNFEKITDVSLGHDGDLLFAGVTLGVGEGAPDDAMVLRTSAEGQVRARVRLAGERLGSVARAALDETGHARLIHWRGMHPAFAMTDPDGRVVWTRTFQVAGDGVWAAAEPAGHGETLVAIADGYDGIAMRILRLDRAGKVLWRHDVGEEVPVSRVRLADSGDGGALVGFSASGPDGLQGVELVRLGRRGQVAWQRTVYRSGGAVLADLVGDGAGAALLLAGQPSGLFHYDALGQLVWVREVPPLTPDGRHHVARGTAGALNVMGELARPGDTRHHWLARIEAAGRLDWARTRTNRMNASLEEMLVDRSGAMVAGGSLISSPAGDTDMLMLAIGQGGTFPDGYGQIETPAMAEVGHAETPTSQADADRPLPILAATTIVRESLAIQAERPVEAELPADDAVRLAAAGTPAPTREVAAPALPPEPAAPERALASLAERAPARPAVKTENEDRPAETVPASLSPSPEAQPARPTAAPRERPETRPAPQPRAAERIASSVSYAYKCTFTCLADSKDFVRYPVSRIIRDASEPNAALFALDIMAMDRGVCAASGGGRVFDRPRLPPACERLN